MTEAGSGGAMGGAAVLCFEEAELNKGWSRQHWSNQCYSFFWLECPLNLKSSNTFLFCHMLFLSGPWSLWRESEKEFSLFFLVEFL